MKTQTGKVLFWSFCAFPVIMILWFMVVPETHKTRKLAEYEKILYSLRDELKSYSEKIIIHSATDTYPATNGAEGLLELYQFNYKEKHALDESALAKIHSQVETIYNYFDTVYYFGGVPIYFHTGPPTIIFAASKKERAFLILNDLSIYMADDTKCLHYTPLKISKLKNIFGLYEDQTVLKKSIE